LFDSFLEAKRGSKESTTVKRYAALVELYLKPLVGTKSARALKAYHLTSAYADWMQNGRNGTPISGSTVRHVHSLLGNILNWGVRRELLSRNVADLIGDDDLPKATKPKPVALNESELKRLLEEAANPTKLAKNRGTLSSQPWFYPAIAFAARTGARRGEVLALRWADVHFDTKSVVIERSVTEALEFKAPKNDRSRTIVIADVLCEVLRTHRVRQTAERLAIGAGYKDLDLVFALPDGRCVDPWNFGRAVLDCIKRAGVTPITLHGLRDTHASLCAKAGVPIEVISHRLGHASIGITVERYLHVYKDRDADAAAAFERLVS